MKIDVLNSGFVELVDHMGSDLTVVNSARVSFDKTSEWDYDQEAIDRIDGTNWQAERLKQEFKKLSEKDTKLINYLAKNNHWTPFAHPQITMRIKAPISIRTQFFKHKQGFVENEISRRYVSAEPEFYIPTWRGKPGGSAKQGSEDFITLGPDVIFSYKKVLETSIECYNKLLDSGVAYARFFSQRSHLHAQWEIRKYAWAIGELVKPLFPESWSVLTNYK